MVLGMDAQVVAASMEVVHEEILTKMADRKGELGWSFMDKFIQLPFVIPRLNKIQRVAYLNKLAIMDESTAENILINNKSKSENVLFDSSILDENKGRIKGNELLKIFQMHVSSGTSNVDDVISKGKLIRQQFSKLNPALADKAAQISLGAVADSFKNDDPVMFNALKVYVPYLSDNPRTIKRAVNLYRFHYFISEARRLSEHKLLSASPKQIARWVVVIIRWPHFVRWLQKNIDTTTDLITKRQNKPANDDSNKLISLVINKAEQCKSVHGWEKSLDKANINHSGWGTDRDLWRFLRDKIANEELKLIKASDYGLW